MASHYCELIEINVAKPIGVYSEQVSEALNKIIKAYKSGASCRAIQINIKINTQDVALITSLGCSPEKSSAVY